MAKDEQQKNTIVRVSFTPKEMESFDVLYSLIGMNKPQDVLRYLLAQRIEKEKGQTLKYGSKRVARETPEQPRIKTVDERVDEVFNTKDPDQIILFLLDIKYIKDTAVVSIKSGVEVAAALSDAMREQMPQENLSKSYIRIQNFSDGFEFPVDDPDVIREVKDYLKGK